MVPERARAPQQDLWSQIRSVPGPLKLAVAALVVVSLAILLRYAAPEMLIPLRALLIVAGLLAAGVAVWWGLRSLGESLEERIEAATVPALGTVVAFGSWLALNKDWDSLRRALLVLGCVALGGSLLVLLSPLWRRVAVSLVLLFHFGGILTAVLTVQAPSGDVPWLPSILWNNVYRKYLLFSYLNNAYHFYSPEPGPPTLIWFRVEFEGDVPARWYKLVNREEQPTRLQYQLKLALTESVNNQQATPPAPEFRDLIQHRLRALGDLLDRRLPEAAREQGFSMVEVAVSVQKLAQEANLPVPPNFLQTFTPKDVLITANLMDQTLLNPTLQYRQPWQLAKVFIASYVRHAALAMQQEYHPDLRVKGVKVYRLTHRIIMPWQLTQGLSPLDQTLYQVYFLGEYDADGKLKEPHAGLLYWQMPIWRIPIVGRKDPLLIDTLSMHSRTAGKALWKKK